MRHKLKAELLHASQTKVASLGAGAPPPNPVDYFQLLAHDEDARSLVQHLAYPAAVLNDIMQDGDEHESMRTIMAALQAMQQPQPLPEQ